MKHTEYTDKYYNNTQMKNNAKNTEQYRTILNIPINTILIIKINEKQE